MIYKLELLIFTVCIVMFSVLVRSLKLRKKEDKDNKLYSSYLSMASHPPFTFLNKGRIQ